MKIYKQESGFYFIEPESFSSKKIMEGGEAVGREIFASPLLHHIGLWNLVRHSTDEQLKELDDLMGK